MKLQNVLESDFELPTADIYFIYDFSEIEDIDNILSSLSDKSITNNFYLVVRGDRVNILMQSKFQDSWKLFKTVSNSDLIIYKTL